MDYVQNYYYQLRFTLLESNSMSPIGETYFSTLFSTSRVDEFSFSATMKDFYYFMVDSETNPSLLFEIALIGLKSGRVNLYLIFYNNK